MRPWLYAPAGEMESFPCALAAFWTDSPITFFIANIVQQGFSHKGLSPSADPPYSYQKQRS